jgi:CHAP domain
VSNPGRVGFLLGAVTVAAAAIALLTPKDSDPPPADDAEVNRIMRTTLVDLIRSEMAAPDSEKYWADVWGSPGPHPAAWCGALILWAMRQVGLTNAKWKAGLALPGQMALPKTTTPQVGDIAYFTKHQHQATVSEVLGNGTYAVLNGNAAGGAITETQTTASKVAAFYSIQPLIDRLLETSDG